MIPETEQMQRIENKLDTFIAQHQQADLDRDKRIKEHHQTLFGNGRPGLKSQIIFIYATLFAFGALIAGKSWGLL